MLLLCYLLIYQEVHLKVKVAEEKWNKERTCSYAVPDVSQAFNVQSTTLEEMFFSNEPLSQRVTLTGHKPDEEKNKTKQQQKQSPPSPILS